MAAAFLERNQDAPEICGFEISTGMPHLKQGGMKAGLQTLESLEKKALNQGDTKEDMDMECTPEECAEKRKAFLKTLPPGDGFRRTETQHPHGTDVKVYYQPLPSTVVDQVKTWHTGGEWKTGQPFAQGGHKEWWYLPKEGGCPGAGENGATESSGTGGATAKAAGKSTCR